MKSNNTKSGFFSSFLLLILSFLFYLIDLAIIIIELILKILLTIGSNSPEIVIMLVILGFFLYLYIFQTIIINYVSLQYTFFVSSRYNIIMTAVNYLVGFFSSVSHYPNEIIDIIYEFVDYVISVIQQEEVVFNGLILSLKSLFPAFSGIFKKEKYGLSLFDTSSGGILNIGPFLGFIMNIVISIGTVVTQIALFILENFSKFVVTITAIGLNFILAFVQIIKVILLEAVNLLPLMQQFLNFFYGMFFECLIDPTMIGQCIFNEIDNILGGVLNFIKNSLGCLEEIGSSSFQTCLTHLLFFSGEYPDILKNLLQIITNAESEVANAVLTSIIQICKSSPCPCLVTPEICPILCFFTGCIKLPGPCIPSIRICEVCPFNCSCCNFGSLG
jgi:hypothetical protein